MRRLAVAAAIALAVLLAAPSTALAAGKGNQRTSYALSYGPGVLDGTYQLRFADGTPADVIDTVTTAAATATRVTGHRISTDPGDHVIDIAMTGDDVCGNACAWTGFDGVRMTDTTIRIESWSFPQQYAGCLAVHELGHALGLAHVADTRQVMAATWTVGVSPCGWGKGDLAGLGKV